MTETLAVRGLRKKYGNRDILNGLDFSVQAGEIVALLGPNGAGKTTTLECIEGVRRPDAGKVTVRGRLGAQLQTGALPGFLRGREVLELFARSGGIPFGPQLLEKLDVDALADRQYRVMSTGQKRRIQLAVALMREPDLLILDEPTAGLDVEGRLAVHQKIAELRDAGRAILLSTHDLAEVRELCDRLILLRDGRIAFDGTPETFADSAEIPGTIRIRTTAGTESFPADGDLGAALLALLPDFQEKGLPVLDIQVERGTMEEQFMKHVGGD